MSISVTVLGSVPLRDFSGGKTAAQLVADAQPYLGMLSSFFGRGCDKKAQLTALRVVMFQIMVRLDLEEYDHDG